MAKSDVILGFLLILGLILLTVEVMDFTYSYFIDYTVGPIYEPLKKSSGRKGDTLLSIVFGTFLIFVVIFMAVYKFVRSKYRNNASDFHELTIRSNTQNSTDNINSINQVEVV